jgi:hypothetical protein
VTNKTESEAVAEIERRLMTKFTSIAPADVAAATAQAHIRFADSKIRDFVPLLVERRASADFARVH